MAQPEPKTDGLTDPRAARMAKLNAYKEKGGNPYAYNYPKTHSAKGLQDNYANLPDGEETTDEVAVAGRVMAMRNGGMFIDLKDTSGRIQIFCHKDSMNEEQLANLDYLGRGPFNQ